MTFKFDKMLGLREADATGTNTGDETASGIVTKLETLTGTDRLNAMAIDNILSSQILFNGAHVATSLASNTSSATPNTYTKVENYTAETDLSGNFSLENQRVNIIMNGIYLLIQRTTLATLSNTISVSGRITLNGNSIGTIPGYGNAWVFAVLRLNAGQYIESYIASPSTASQNIRSALYVFQIGV